MFKKYNLWWIAIAIMILFAFDQMMRNDRERLCGNDATAYQGC